MADHMAYTPQDPLFLWLLSDPAHPRLVGELSLALGGQSVALRYGEEWLRQGFALSEDLPLVDALFVPTRKQEIAGAVEDARPDRWGERVIKKLERSPRMSLLEYLLFAGHERYGALGVGTNRNRYEPWHACPLPALGDLKAMQEVVRKVLANEPIDPLASRLLRPGISLGGARPKALIEIDQAQWIVKFGEGEQEDTPLIEHAAMTLAAKCSIHVAATRAVSLGPQHAIAVRRFDRKAGQRIHAISALVALRAAGEPYGYPQLAQQMRRMSSAAEIAPQQEQIFRRMVFNILIDNTDDHEKNHGLLRQTEGTWSLSPAFDIVPSMSGLGYQAIEVGQDGQTSSLENALSQVSSFGLRLAAAKVIVQEIAAVVEGWRNHFKACGVGESDLAMLEQYLDKGPLGAQRRSYAAR
jgi:serine/threonine-protein kinase HipA